MYTFKTLENKNGELYDVFDEETEERVGHLKMRDGVLYLLPVFENEVLWGDPLNTWIYQDIAKQELDDAEKIVVFSETRASLDEYLEFIGEEAEIEEAEDYGEDALSF